MKIETQLPRVTHTAILPQLKEILSTIDEEGFNDATALWKLYGGAKKDQPSDFMRTQQANSILDEILKSGFHGIKTEAGRYGGTKMHSLLALEYVRWLDSNFALHHNAVGHTLATQQAPLAITQETPEVQAITELNAIWQIKGDLLKSVGFGKGIIKAEFLEDTTRLEAKYNATILTPSARQKMIVGQKKADRTSKVVAVAEVEVGGQSVKVTHLAKMYGVPPELVNKALCALNWQFRTEGGYQPKPDGRKYCDTAVRVQGKFKGEEFITGWREALVDLHLPKMIKFLTK